MSKMRYYFCVKIPAQMHQDTTDWFIVLNGNNDTSNIVIICYINSWYTNYVKKVSTCHIICPKWHPFAFKVTKRKDWMKKSLLGTNNNLFPWQCPHWSQIITSLHEKSILVTKYDLFSWQSPHWSQKMTCLHFKFPTGRK